MLRFARSVALVLALMPAISARAANFFEGFDGVGGPGGAWQTANWYNGGIFGCGFAYSEAWRTGWGALQLNVNSSNVSSVRCGEVRTWQRFTYGKFVTRLQPGMIAGGNSSFFLYTGTHSTTSHFEIDIEFIHQGSVLHTDVWTAGRQNPQQFVVGQGWRTIGFEWRPDFVRWFHVDGAGNEHEFRRVYTRISAPMQLMLNHWVGSNSSAARAFLGPYYYGGGPAFYDWVRVSD
jgi:endo-1,3-1,4-beta-glycanase ExoK